MTLASVVIERIFDGLLLIAGLFFSFRYLKGFPLNHGQARALGLLTDGAIFLGVFILVCGAVLAVERAAIPFKVLDEKTDTTSNYASVATMHFAKGLEFRAVVVMACDDEIIPLQERIETVGDDADLQEVYETERHLLYVACTRARDYLLVTGVKPASEFIDDLQQ